MEEYDERPAQSPKSERTTEEVTEVDLNDTCESGPGKGGHGRKAGRGVNDQQPSPISVGLEESGTGPTSEKKSTYIFVYCSHFLSAWGDRMWSFGVGLFLVGIASENLQLPATYGLASGLTVFLLGALVGDWVDSTARLKAAQLALVLQNVLVVVCAGGIYAYLILEDKIKAVEGGWAVPLCHAGIITLAVLSDLASLARVIAVERDWIVKICHTDTDMLAKMTATLRRIDQTTLVLAPIATGQVMTYAGLEFGAIFIGAWNLCSVALEYYLMWKVYTTVPALAEEKRNVRMEEDVEPPTTATDKAKKQPVPQETSFSEAATDDQTTQWRTPFSESLEGSRGSGITEATPLISSEGRKAGRKQRSGDKRPAVKTRNGSCCGRLLYQFTTLYRGWRTFMGYGVALAGLALACLYMTVLGFDNITTAYAVTQGVSESIVGVLMGVSAVFGMIGTFTYPVLRRRVGLVRTGIIALSCQVVCLSLCVVSVWMPGSPFDPLYLFRDHDTVNATSVLPATPVPQTDQPETTILSTTPTLDKNLTTPFTDTTASQDIPTKSWEDYISVALLMAGIVLARFGLWMADLSITQLFLEEVIETERGIVNGVQSSLNKLMDVLKFVLVVAIPDTETFGYLIIISFAFVCIGWLMYAVFVRRARGHFFHIPKCTNNNNYEKI